MIISEVIKTNDDYFFLRCLKEWGRFEGSEDRGEGEARE